MQTSFIELKRLLPRGGIRQIANELGIGADAVSAALKLSKPGHPAVQRALQMAEASGALVAAQALARLGSAS